MENTRSPLKRVKYEANDNLVKVIIKPKLKIFTAVFLLALSFIWSTSGIFIFTELYIRNLNIINNSYMFLWFLAWLTGQLFFVYAIFWRITGKEILVKTPLTLQYIKDIAGFSTLRSYDLSKVSDVSTKPCKRDIYQLLGIEFLSPERNIRFSYNGSNKDLGINLSLEEADYIVNKLEIKKNQD